MSRRITNDIPQTAVMSRRITNDIPAISYSEMRCPFANINISHYLVSCKKSDSPKIDRGSDILWEMVRYPFFKDIGKPSFRLLERLVEKIFLLIFRLLKLASRSTGREDRRLVRCELPIAFSSTTRCSSCPSVNSPIDRRRHDTSIPIHRIVSRIENDSFLLSLERCFFLSLVHRGSSYTRISRASLDHPENFWSEQEEKISCFQRWKKVFDKTNLLRPRWFHDGLLNVTCNCLDPHLGKHGAIKQRLFTIRR
jgi:hypothetical protein